MAPTERKRASDYPPEVLALFDGYVHNTVSRREFLVRAAKYAVGGMTALAMLDSLQPNFAWAEQVPKGDARVKVAYVTYPSPRGTKKVRGYLARPARAKGKLPGGVVIHENPARLILIARVPAERGQRGRDAPARRRGLRRVRSQGSRDASRLHTPSPPRP